MTTKRLFTIYVIIVIVISLPFAFIHLTAKPDDAPISLLQHATAVLANFFGPWGVVMVRLVDFPNAGLRSFSWVWAIGLTLIGGLLLWLPGRIAHRHVRLLLTVFWALFVIIWFAIGLRQIADGLL